MSVRRVYVEKKTPFAIQAKELKEELAGYLGISVSNTRVLIRYDIENITEEVYQRGLNTIFSEPPLDMLYEETFPKDNDDMVFSVEYLAGQFDQRADSAVQCLKLLKEEEDPVIRTAVTYVLSGRISEEEQLRIKNHCINPVDSAEASEDIPDTLIMEYDIPEDVEIVTGFTQMNGEELQRLYQSLSLAMTWRDFLHIHSYFSEKERREPSITEIRVLDTYWSDHCRHTTFQTELKNVTFTQGDYTAPILDSYEKYLADRRELFKERPDKYMCLMDLALIAMRKLQKQGKLQDKEESEEINACSIVVPVTIDGKEEEWLVNFKNETHNHPTEIEPFGGAATCLGGAIRDPLSGRTYVYQAMRITGAADPRALVEETMKGKLPQKKLVQEAARGYSSYGNQIGLATGYVRELYHPGYEAKRMEVGAVLGAAPRSAVRRETSDPGDLIILLGGRTGRDGCGGATGSSKIHTEDSIETCGAEVQKGNAPTERKIQRLFRRSEVSILIKKCNDFGAGGVSVAIGELADGLDINLDLVPKKYAGLDGTEIAISESQERMAVVIDPKDEEAFLAFAAEENLEANRVAVVKADKRLTMTWRGKTIVDISRPFLDTNGAHLEAEVTVVVPNKAGSPMVLPEVKDVKDEWLKTVSDLNVCSQKGLVEMFDSSIGAGTVLMPFGGKYQMTPVQTMAAKLPLLSGTTDTVTLMSYGFDPYLSSWSPYHGAVYAVVSSIAKITAAGGDYTKIRFTFQEYFRRLNNDPKRWGEPFQALLGAYEAQMGFELASIGGKDSMSGSFNDKDVPPTLISFAVAAGDGKHIISPELKQDGNLLLLLEIEKDKYDLPVYHQAAALYENVYEDICRGRILSAYAIEGHGPAEAISKMAFGNGLGVSLNKELTKEELFASGFGNLIIEVPKAEREALKVKGRVIGQVTAGAAISYDNETIFLADICKAWEAPLEPIFPTGSKTDGPGIVDSEYRKKEVYINKNKIAKPTVFIPVFPGTNCEYDSAKAFERAGASVNIRVFRNQSAEDIRSCVSEYEKEIDQAQIVMFPGGFSAGDEPEGSAKFFAAVFRNEKMKEAIRRLLYERDGLMLGICNGFQALIKLGLVPHGEISPQCETSPTLTYNTIGRHISRMVYTKVVSDKSPWLALAKQGGVYCNPASHGEGRFVASDEWIKNLMDNGQIATRYCDPNGNIALDEKWNPNGSYQAIEGITSPDGRIYGKMAHSERRGDYVAKNIYGEQDMKVFESGVSYFK